MIAELVLTIPDWLVWIAEGLGIAVVLILATIGALYTYCIWRYPIDLRPRK